MILPIWLGRLDAAKSSTQKSPSQMVVSLPCKSLNKITLWLCPYVIFVCPFLGELASPRNWQVSVKLQLGKSSSQYGDEPWVPSNTKSPAFVKVPGTQEKHWLFEVYNLLIIRIVAASCGNEMI